LFLVLLIVLVLSSVNSRQPMLSYELLVLAAAGVILAAIARSQVRNAEGTRTGLRLASYAWWVSMLGGAGFAAYLFANQWVLERKSGQTADDFFKELQAGRTQQAFHDYMIPPEDRGRADPEDPAKPDPVARARFEQAYAGNGYLNLKHHDLVRLFARNPNAVQVERIGLRDFGQELGKLRAAHTYRLRCPEGTFEVQVGLIASEARRGGLRWQIPAHPAPGITPLSVSELSQYGRLVLDLQTEGERVSAEWINLFNSGRISMAHLMTTPEGFRQPIEAAITQLSVFGGGTAATFPLGPALLPAERSEHWRLKMGPTKTPDGAASPSTPVDMPFEDLAHIGFFRQDELRTPFPEEKWAKLRDLWRSPQLLSTANRPTMIGTNPAEPTTTIVTPHAITVISSADLYFPGLVLFVRCSIAAECTAPEVLAAVNTARDLGLEGKNDGSVLLRTLPSRQWRIAWLRTDMETHSPMPTSEPGGPPR
jgi:hypothetical protein